MTALTTTTREKSKPKAVTARLKVAIDAMAHEGLPMDEAARRAGLTTSAVRKALTRQHVLAYMAEQRKIVQSAEQPRTFKRMVTLLHQDDNKAAAVAAGRVLMNAPDETPTYGTGQQRAPGIVVMIVGGPVPSDTSRHPTITVRPTDADG